MKHLSWNAKFDTLVFQSSTAWEAACKLDAPPSSEGRFAMTGTSRPCRNNFSTAEFAQHSSLKCQSNTFRVFPKHTLLVSWHAAVRIKSENSLHLAFNGVYVSIVKHKTNLKNWSFLVWINQVIRKNMSSFIASSLCQTPAQFWCPWSCDETPSDALLEDLALQAVDPSAAVGLLFQDLLPGEGWKKT